MSRLLYFGGTTYRREEIVTWVPSTALGRGGDPKEKTAVVAAVSLGLRPLNTLKHLIEC